MSEELRSMGFQPINENSGTARKSLAVPNCTGPLKLLFNHVPQAAAGVCVVHRADEVEKAALTPLSWHIPPGGIPEDVSFFSILAKT